MIVERPIYLLMFSSYILFCWMHPYTASILPITFVATHISSLHASIVAHMQDRFSEFYSVTGYKCRLLWSLPRIAPWVEFGI